MKNLILICVVTCLVACSKNNEHIGPFLDCEQVAGAYKAYNGQDIECQFHYVLTEYNNQQFIELRARCADLTRPYVINGNCVDICEESPYDPNSDCGKYLRDREEIEILLIEK